jgi:ribosome maturation factor RimP
MIDKKKVEGIVAEWLEGKEYFLTDLSISDDDSIVVEIDHKEGVWIDDCVELSKFIETRLDRNDEDYELEVGSAGIGQPFKVYRQYENHVGDIVEVRTSTGEKLKGTLKAVTPEGITLTLKVKYKPEGAKRAKMVDEDRNIAFSAINTCQAFIDFK